MSSNTPPPGAGGQGWGQPGQQGPQGPGYGPQGPGQGPQGPGYGPQGPGYGPQGPGYGPQGPQGPQSPGFGPDYGPGGQPPSRRTSRGLTVVVIAVVVAVLIGGGAFAFKLVKDKFSAAGPQAAEAIPANAVFYVGIDLDPSAAQKVNALTFLNHFPAFTDASGVTDASTDIRKTIFEKALDASPCGDVTYAADVEPWIGSKFGVAGMPPASGGSDPLVVGAIEVKDQDKATKGLNDLASCGGSEQSFGLAFTGDYAVIAETQAQADQYAAAAGSSSLADNAGFKADMDSLGDLGVATAWVNIAGALDEFGGQIPVDGGSQLDFLKTAYQRAAITFRFERDHAELATSIYGKTTDFAHDDNQIVNLPDSTVFAVSEAGGGERLAQSWDDIKAAAEDAGVDIDSELSAFEDQTGLVVPDDLETVLGKNVMFAVDQAGLTADALNAQDPSQLNLGARFTGDKDKMNAIYTKVESLLQEQTGGAVPFVKKDTADGVVIASNDSYADQLSGDGTLGDSDAFTSVVDDASGKEFVLFFNFDQIEEQVLQAAQDDGAPAEVIDNLRPLQAVALTSEVDGDYTKGTLVVSVND